MLLFDFLEYLTTPCSPEARSMGFLTSSLQTQARHRRCWRAWQPHLLETRRIILQQTAACPQRRKAVLFGAGLLHDIPLGALAWQFDEVVLVDVVFLRATRREAASLKNVRCLEADVTGVMHALFRDPNAPLPRSQPALFLDDPALDFTVSVNLLSQLPVIPKRWLRREDAEVETWARDLQAAHLDYLRRLPGRVTLITDTGGMHRDRTGKIVHAWDNLHGLALPKPDAEWEWKIAPAPEADRKLDHLARVAACTSQALPGFSFPSRGIVADSDAP